MNSSINNNVNLGGTQEIEGLKRFLQVIRGKSGIPYTSAPANTTYSGLAIQDSNNSTWASFEGVQYNSGTNCAQMTVRGNSGTLSRMYVQENSDGKVTYSYGQQAGGNWVMIPRGVDNYLLFCWGGSSSGANGTTITFPKAYSNAPAVILSGSGSSREVYANVVTSVSTTNFVQGAIGGAASQGFLWFSIGTIQK